MLRQLMETRLRFCAGVFAFPLWHILLRALSLPNLAIKQWNEQSAQQISIAESSMCWLKTKPMAQPPALSPPLCLPHAISHKQRDPMFMSEGRAWVYKGAINRSMSANVMTWGSAQNLPCRAQSYQSTMTLTCWYSWEHLQRSQS